MSSKDLEKAKGGELDESLMQQMEAASATAKGEIDLQTDVRLPSLQLVQATTQTESDAKPGQILDTLTGDAADEVEVVPVAVYKTRAYFGSGTVGDAPTCSSPDALNGYGEVADKLKEQGAVGPAGDSGACQQCPQADWRSGGRCQLRFNYLTLIPGDDVGRTVPRNLMMHGTSAKIASRLNTLLYEQRFFWGNVIRLWSKQEKNPKGQYNVWQVARGREATPEEMMAAFGTHQQFEASRQAGARVVTEETPAAKDEGGDDIPF